MEGKPYGTEFHGIGKGQESLVLDENFNAEPYLEDALIRLKSSDREKDRKFLLEDMTDHLRSWGCEGANLKAQLNTACFLLWAIENDLNEKKLSPMVNDLPGIILTKSFHDLFRIHMDEGRDLGDSVRFHWHHALFTLYHIAYEESGELEKGFLMLTQAFAMSEIYVNNGMWKEAQSGLEDTISFGEDLDKERKLPKDYDMLMGIATFYLGYVLKRTEQDDEAMKAYYREALDWLNPIPEDFNPGIPEVMKMCRDAL